MRYHLLACLLLGVAPCFAAEAPQSSPQLRLLVPAYFYPAGKGLQEWERMAKAAKDVPIVAIANPASGPGERRDPNYTAAIKLARDAGVTVIGYVSTSYAKRPLKEVESDINRWKDLYPEVNGVFLDEQSSGKTELPYYRALAADAQARWRKDLTADNAGHGDPLVMSNPGTVCAQEYVTPWSGINLFCLQENRFGLERYQPPTWLKSVPPAQVVGLVYNEPSIAAMRTNVREALQKRVGYLYVTDRTGANPWDGLPGYWELEVAEVRRANGKSAVSGLFTDVPITHWAYDAVQQLIQSGFITSIPEVTFIGKLAFTRMRFAQETQARLDYIRSTDLKSWKYASADLKALEKLAQAFAEELGHVGVTPERVATVIQELRAKLKLPTR